MFSDFQCPVCRRITDATHQIPEEWPGDVRVEFRNLPLKMHANAENAAVAAMAAHRQGKFWEMHDMLFANQQALDQASLEGYAQKLGLDMARWKKDVADPALRMRVHEDAALAEKLAPPRRRRSSSTARAASAGAAGSASVRVEKGAPRE